MGLSLTAHNAVITGRRTSRRRPQMLHAWSRHGIMLERILELKRSSLESIHRSERGRVDWVLLVASTGCRAADVSWMTDADKVPGLSALLRECACRTRIFNRTHTLLTAEILSCS